MRVTQSQESNINILAHTRTSRQIISCLDGMPFDLYRCRHVIDIFMIPRFIQLVDGNILTKDTQDIDVWECYLTSWTGRMKKCPRCKSYYVCNKSYDGPIEEIDIGPEYNAPIILLHADKKQLEVEGLITLIPPMPVHDIFSLELKDWIKATCLLWHKKALHWRKKFDQWNAAMELQYNCKRKTYREITDTKWMPRKITVEFSSPEFDK